MQGFKRSLTWMLVLLALGACSGAATLRDAQDSFNEAAAGENRLRYGDSLGDLRPADFNAGSEVAAVLAVRNGYAESIAIIDSLGVEQTSLLKREGLWGGALALQAMALWRLTKYEQALEKARGATEEAGGLGVRDLAMIRALPSLIRNDQANRKIASSEEADGDPAARLAEAGALLDGAMTDLEALRAEIGEGEPVQLYLIQSLFVVYLNKRDACRKQHSGLRDQNDCACPMKRQAQEAFNDADGLLEASVPAEERTAFNRFWGGKTGLAAGREPEACEG